MASKNEANGVHIMVRLPTGGEVHEFVLPMGYTVDQVKRAIFSQIPELSNDQPTDYNLGTSKEEVFTVEFSKLRNVPSVAEKDVVELELIAKKPEVRYGLVKDKEPSSNSNTPSVNNNRSPRSLPTTPSTTAKSTTTSSTTTTTSFSSPATKPSTTTSGIKSPSTTNTATNPKTTSFSTPPAASSSARKPSLPASPSPAARNGPTISRSFSSRETKTTLLRDTPSVSSSGGTSISSPSLNNGNNSLNNSNNTRQLDETQRKLKDSEAQVNKLNGQLKTLLDNLQKRVASLPEGKEVKDAAEFVDQEKAFLHSLIEVIDPETARKLQSNNIKSPTIGKKDTKGSSIGRKGSVLAANFEIKRLDEPRISEENLPPVTKLTPEERAKMLQAEFLETEEKYVEHLKFLVETFMDPMLAQASTLQISPETIDVIFSKELRMLLKMHEELLADLKNPDKRFAESLGHFVPFLKLYSVYINNNADSSVTLLEYMTNSKKFKEFLNECMAKSKSNLDLASYLIMPVQRLPRYELLLRDLVKYTTNETERIKLATLLEKVKELNVHINESKRRKENTEKIFTIQKRIGGKKKLNLFDKQTREFIREGSFQVSKSEKEGGDDDKKKKKFDGHQLFLFSDMLLDTVIKKDKLKVSTTYPLTEITIKSTGALTGENTIVLKVLHKDNELTIKSDVAEEIEAWTQDIKKYSDLAKEGEPSINRQLTTVDLGNLIGDTLTSSLN